MKKLFALLLTLPFFLTACGIDYYRPAALREAREYAVENLRELDESDISFIRFASPEFYAVPLYQATKMQKKAAFASELFAMRPSGLDQTVKRDVVNRHYIGTFMWLLPQSERVVLVTGVCESDFAGWTARRVVHRPLLPANPYKQSALRMCRDKILYTPEHADNAPVVSDALSNYVRFAPPAVYRRAPPENTPDSALNYQFTFYWFDQAAQDGVAVFASGSEDFKTFEPRSVRNGEFTPAQRDSQIYNFTEMPSYRIEDYIE